MLHYLTLALVKGKLKNFLIKVVQASAISVTLLQFFLFSMPSGQPITRSNFRILVLVLLLPLLLFWRLVLLLLVSRMHLFWICRSLRPLKVFELFFVLLKSQILLRSFGNLLLEIWLKLIMMVFLFLLLIFLRCEK